MFKFFRVYNKVILAVGGVVLMIAFLVPQAVQMFGPNPIKEKIGTAHGEKVTVGDSRSAAYEIQLLKSLPIGTGLATEDELAWMLMQKDAQNMGIFASNREVDLALQSAGIDEEILTQMAKDRKTTTGFIRLAVHNWLVAEQYRQLVTGTAYRDPGVGSASLAINKLETIYRYLQQIQGQNLPPQYLQQMAYFAGLEANGTRRLGGPMLQHFIKDNYANVDGRVVLIRPQTDDADTPDQATLNQVFETYKDALPGQGEPFPFGYKIPDRVKLEYARVPMDDVRKAVSVEYLDVLDAYRRNPQRFAEEGAEAPEMPSSDAVETLTTELTDRKAEQLAAKIVAQIEGLLVESLRGYAQKDGYTDLPEDYTPLSWADIANAVRDEHGVSLNVLGNPSEWVSVDQLSTLDGIGLSTIGEGQGVPFDAYVSATRKLSENNPDLNVPRSLRTQVNVASKALRGFDGNLYFFRLTDVESAHAPASLDLVKDRVTEDAKIIAAYDNLVADLDAWKQRAIDQGLEAVAEAADSGVSQTFPFQRVAGNEGAAPNVTGVGTSREFVDNAFALVEDLDDAQADIETLPLADRVTATALPNAELGPAIAVFVLDAFEPLTRSGYESAVTGGATFTANSALSSLDVENPMSIEAIAKRTGFDLASYRDN